MIKATTSTRLLFPSLDDLRNQQHSLYKLSHKKDQPKKYSIEKQEVKDITPKMGYDLETSGCVLSASNFIEEMNACCVGQR